MRTIDAPEALALLREVVEENGEDFVYSPPGGDSLCVYYQSDGSPSCIVGHVLHKLGVTLGHLSPHNSNMGSSVYDIAPALRHEARVMFTKEARGMLQEAQMRQDNEATWGEALQVAEARASGISFEGEA